MFADVVRLTNACIIIIIIIIIIITTGWLVMSISLPVCRHRWRMLFCITYKRYVTFQPRVPSNYGQ